MAQLQVNLIEGKDLKQKDTFSQNDSYVQIYLDEKRHKQKSRVQRNTNNPTWNETFVFNHLHGQDHLHVDVYDQDSVKDEKIGSLKIDLKDLYDKGQIDQWFKITGKLGLMTHGEIHLILFYERLQI